MTARGALALAALVVALATGCAETTIDTSVTTADPADTAPTVPPTTIDPDATVADLVVLLQDAFTGLDEQIVENDGQTATLARIDAIWAVAEDKVQDEFPDALFGFQQAVALAHSGVERRRPADASKGQLLLGPLVAQVVAAG